MYQVVWPRGRRTKSGGAAVARRVRNLDAKTVAFLWDYQFEGDKLYPMIKQELQHRFPEVRFLGYELFGNFHTNQEGEILAALPEKLHSLGCDAAIIGVGC
jgi:hypothetical protein